MDPNLDDDVGDVLAEINGNLAGPQNVTCEQADFSVSFGKTFETEAKVETDDELTNLFEIDEETSTGREMTAGIFEALLPPLSKFRDMTDNLTTGANSSTQKRSLSASSLQANEDAKKSKHGGPLSQLKQHGTEDIVGQGEVKRSDRGEKVFSAAPKPKHVCKECRKVFKRAHNLKIHGRLHSGAKPYSCPFAMCDKEFRWKSSIVSHMNWHRTKRGDILPGEPEDTSIQAAALRQGTTRRANAEKKKNKGRMQRGGQVEEVGVSSMTVSGMGGQSCGVGTADMTGEGKELKKEDELIGQGEVVREAIDEMQAEGEVGHDAREVDGYEVGVELNELVVEMTGLGGGIYKSDGHGGGEGGQGFGGVDEEEAFTPSTTAASYDKSPPMMELDEVVPMALVSGKEGIEGGEENVLMISGLDCSEFEADGDAFCGLLDEE